MNSSNQYDKYLTFSNFDISEMDTMVKFCEMFNIALMNEWSDQITHLIIKLQVNGKPLKTRKYINAILSHCYIVTDEWVQECMNSNTLVSEVNYGICQLKWYMSVIRIDKYFKCINYSNNIFLY